MHTDNETWVVEAGDTVIQKKASCGIERLSPWERLVYCLWVADYGMRNAGDHMFGRRLLGAGGSITPEQAGDPGFDLKSALT